MESRVGGVILQGPKEHGGWLRHVAVLSSGTGSGRAGLCKIPHWAIPR